MIWAAVPWLIFGLLSYFASIQFDSQVRRLLASQGVTEANSSSGAFLVITAIALCFILCGAILVYLAYRRWPRTRSHVARGY
jgi:uncharacterized membrane protein YidH (DUF202 family)